MTINHGNLDTLLGKILEAHKEGEVKRSSAVGAIAHIIAAVAKGNTGEVASWTDNPAIFDRWLAGCSAKT